MTAFNFTVFKAVMDVADIEEVTYAFTLKVVFAYIKKSYGIDFDELINTSVSATATSTSIPIAYSVLLKVGQEVRIGTSISYIASISNDTLLTTSTITLTTAITTPVVNAAVTILRFTPDISLQYAVFQHAKYLYERQKKNAMVVDTVTDASGNRATYKDKPAKDILQTYAAYSPEAIAFTL